MNALQLFNPSQQSEQELIKNFCIRKKEFKRIFTEIKKDKMQNAPQHFIIQGVRGGGKTTLLLRTYYEIKKEPSLNNWLTPLIFNEEQYSVNKLFKFWEQIAKELESESDKYDDLLDLMQESDETEKYEEHCYDILFNTLKKDNIKICLLMDNIGDFLNKLTKKEQQRLREVLITNNQIRIIGASSEVLESFYKYDEPFYEFFKSIHLKELKKEETHEFLLELDRICETNKIAGIIENTPGRIEALRILTGGVPRTIVLMYEIFVNDSKGESFKHLEQLLDRVTPLYKHRMDDLKPQQQEIVDCVALNWDAITVKEIARITRIESKAVSAQLGLLEKNNIILKKATSTKNNLYQVKERFFNIWYIMRNGRKSDKNKVLWLIRFLEVWCDKDTLTDMINTHISKLKTGEIYDKYAYSLSEALACLVTSGDTQYQLLTETKKYLESVNSDFAKEISDSDLNFILTKVAPLIQNNKYDEALKILSNKESNTGILETFKAIAHEGLTKYQEAKKHYLLAIEKGDKRGHYGLAGLYKTLKDYQKAEEHYLLVLKNGLIKEALLGLGLLYNTELKNYKKAEEYYALAIENDSPEAMIRLALLYMKQNKNKSEAIRLTKKVHELNKTNTDHNFIYCTILLWGNEIDLAIKIAQSMIEDETIINSSLEDIKDILIMLLARKQLSFVYNIFDNNKFQIKERLKPIYFTLMTLIQDKYPDEIKKMGNELQEIVTEVLNEVSRFEKIYKYPSS